MSAKVMKRWLSSLGAFLGAVLPLGQATAKAVAPGEAPAAWMAYATTSMSVLTARLNGEAVPAPRVRAVLDATRPAPDQPTPILVVKLWIDGQGAITRTEFASLGDAQADQDLRTLIAGQKLAPPPRDMRQPLRIALQLPPTPPVDSTATGQ